MPLRRNLLRGDKRAHLVRICRRIKHAPVPCDDGHNEERARQVAEKRENPMPQHHWNRESAMQYRYCRELYT
jgi:hypothetical protein